MISAKGNLLMMAFFLAAFFLLTTNAKPYADCADCGICQEQYKPVCGSDGVTYHNACQLGCHKNCRVPGRLLKVAHDGECGTQIIQ